MSGIAVSEDAINLFYLMRLKATVSWPQGVVGGDRYLTLAAAVACLPAHLGCCCRLLLLPFAAAPCSS